MIGKISRKKHTSKQSLDPWICRDYWKYYYREEKLGSKEKKKGEKRNQSESFGMDWTLKWGEWDFVCINRKVGVKG